jgi:hypothetical protein
MLEEMIGGALLPFTSPQAMIGGAANLSKTISTVSNSKRFGDYIADALSQ